MSRFGSQARSSNRNTQRNESKFQNFGSVTTTKATQEKLGLEINQQLKESGITVAVNVYLPKGTSEITFRNGDTFYVSFKEVTGKDGKALTTKDGRPMDYIVGKAAIIL